MNIVVCTPGRLLDLVNEGICDLSNVQYLVLDEGMSLTLPLALILTRPLFFPPRFLYTHPHPSHISLPLLFTSLPLADRMLDMGFENDIRAIIRNVPKTRQTVMFSATWPQSIQGAHSPPSVLNPTSSHLRRISNSCLSIYSESNPFPFELGLASEFLNKPIKITIGSEDLVANKNVKQIVEVIEGRARDERLIQLLKVRKTLILISTAEP